MTQKLTNINMVLFCHLFYFATYIVTKIPSLGCWVQKYYIKNIPTEAGIPIRIMLIMLLIYHLKSDASISLNSFINSGLFNKQTTFPSGP